MSSPLNASAYEMNINMVEHQRGILSVLGVDVWAPKVGVQTRSYTSSLYRDQAVVDAYGLAHPMLESGLANSSDLDRFSDVGQLATVAQKDQLSRDQVLLKAQLLKQQSTEQKAHDRQEQTLTKSLPESNESRAVAPFELQALMLQSCVVLVDTASLTEQQAVLWNNIQMAKSSQLFTIKWPFALASLQDGRGAGAYVRGFIDSLKYEKKLLSLGKLEHVEQQNIIELASLAEMLEQPQLKRKLWMYMQS